MLSHTGTLWHYLGSFVFYTLATIGVIYGVYWYTRKNAAVAAAAAAAKAEEGQIKLELESTLALEPNKNLYVVRNGVERFLLVTSAEGTQLLSRLDNVPTPPVVEEVVAEPVVDLPMAPKPWYATEPPPVIAQRKRSFGEQLRQSVELLIASRTKR